MKSGIRSFIFIILVGKLGFSGNVTTAQDLEIGAKEMSKTAVRVQNAIKSGIEFYSSIGINGGYVYFYTVDLSQKWGEGITDDQTVEVQSPGTPAVGMAFLKAFNTTGEPQFLEAAKGAANALIMGQNNLGGWEHTISFDKPKSRRVSFDDDQTQGAIRFLIALDAVIDDPALTAALDRSLDLMLKSQHDNGAWPHQHPEQGNYHDFATFNDGGINDCIRVMMEAYRSYQKTEYMESIIRAGRFLMISQLPPPQPGWAQQYNQYLQPAWARTFEPPSVCTLVTLRNINTLMDLYVFTGNRLYLEPIPDAISWLEAIRLDNGMWARFVEIHTNRSLYYDRGRIRVDDPSQLSIERSAGYGYQVDLETGLKSVQRRFQQITEMEGQQYTEPQELAEVMSGEKATQALARQIPEIRRILDTQDAQGRWITIGDRYKKIAPGKLWDGEYMTGDRISSAVFIGNIDKLCDFLKLYQNIHKN